MQIKTNIVSCHAADSKPVKKEVNGPVIIPPLVFPCEAEPTLTCLLKPVSGSNKIMGDPAVAVTACQATGTNALAYFVGASVRDEKSLIRREVSLKGKA